MSKCYTNYSLKNSYVYCKIINTCKKNIGNSRFINFIIYNDSNLLFNMLIKNYVL